MLPALALLLLAVGAAPRRTLVVAADGSAPFRDVQAAVDAAPDGNVEILVKPGVYRQVVDIKADHVSLRGLGRSPAEVVLTFGNSHAMAGGTAKSASTTVSGNDFLAENLSFENSFSRDHPDARGDTQAVALLTLGDRQVYRHVRLIGAQDTLYANSGTCHSPAEIAAATPCRAARQLFADSYIEGHVDFIFGDAKAVFLRDTIHAIPHPLSTLTAQSRVYLAEDSGYLFLDCTVTGTDAPNILLGRPWRAYSTVVFIDTDFEAALNPAGWAEWDGRLGTSTYAEYGSHGMAGDVSKRLPGTHRLTPAEAAMDTAKNWLAGSDGWNP